MHPYLEGLPPDGSDGSRPWDADPDTFRGARTAALPDEVTDAAMDLLSVGGPDRITLGSIAKRLTMRPSTLHFRTGGLAELVVMVVETFAWRWNRWATNPYLRTSVISIPRTGPALEAAAVWLALLEVAAGELRAGRPEAIAAIRAAVADEAKALGHHLGQALGRPTDRTETHLAMAVAIGLRTMLAHGLDGMTAHDADGVLAKLLAALSGGPTSGTV